MTIDSILTAKIDFGMLALVGVERSDTHKAVEQLAQKLMSFRLFSDAQGKMNLDILAASGAVLLVPQFTLAADTHKGRRPGFSSAATPEQAHTLFLELASRVRELAPVVETGQFGAEMQVALVNDGPVTFWLQTKQYA